MAHLLLKHLLAPLFRSKRCSKAPTTPRTCSSSPPQPARCAAHTSPVAVDLADLAEQLQGELLQFQHRLALLQSSLAISPSLSAAHNGSALCSEHQDAGSVQLRQQAIRIQRLLEFIMALEKRHQEAENQCRQLETEQDMLMAQLQAKEIRIAQLRASVMLLDRHDYSNGSSGSSASRQPPSAPGTFLIAQPLHATNLLSDARQ